MSNPLNHPAHPAHPSQQNPPTLPPTTHHIGAEHQAQLAQMQHVLEWLASERVRLQNELLHVLSQGERMQAQLGAFLQQRFGIVGPYTLDTEARTITTPNEPQTPIEPEAAEAAEDPDTNS